MDSELEEKIENIKSDKPTFPISSPNKLGVGLLSLIFSIALTFVYVEERQRGIALLISIPLGVCIIYFAYLWMKDDESLKIYKQYQKDISNLLVKKNPKYIPKKEKILFGEIGTVKATLGLLAGLVMMISIAMQVEKIRISTSFNILFLVLLMTFVLVSDYEGKTVMNEISNIEKELYISVDSEIKNKNTEIGTTT